MTLELRGSARPTLQQALRWIGSRVDDIYGASIGKLEDVWMDPDTGEPLWLLVHDERIAGRHTLVPFDQAASDAGHLWVPFEREVVRRAPPVRPSAPLSHELSDTLRRYYAEAGHAPEGEARAGMPARETPAPSRRFAAPGGSHREVPLHEAPDPGQRRERTEAPLSELREAPALREVPQPAPPSRRQLTLDELQAALADGIDLEFVGRMHLRGNVVQMQPLRARPDDD